MDEWCTIESDPGVFTELIEKFGVKGVSVEEIYSLDPDVQKLGLSYGFVFLFKYKNESDSRTILSYQDSPPNLFFAKQVIQNACATQAILSVLLNAEDVQLGETLCSFKTFTAEMDPESKGHVIGSSDVIREAHNSFSRPDSFVVDDSKHNNEKGDAYHFIAYVPFKGSVYELDGLKDGPILLGHIESGEKWWQVAKPAIQNRMDRYSASETHFTLLTICSQRTLELEKQISLLAADREVLDAALQGGSNSIIVLSDGTTAGGESGKDLRAARTEVENEMSRLRSEITDEEHKQQMRRAENVRRKHNFLPLIVELLRQLAAKGKLEGLLAEARQRVSAEGRARSAASNVGTK